MHNNIITDIANKVYDNMYDITCICEREQYEYILTLLEYYYNNIVIAKLTYNKLKSKVRDSIENIHRIISHSNNIDAIEFMLLCDCINRINEYFKIDLIIDFDDYIDIDNSFMIFYNSRQLKHFRKRHSYYDFNYSDINITAYIAQYIS